MFLSGAGIQSSQDIEIKIVKQLLTLKEVQVHNVRGDIQQFMKKALMFQRPGSKRMMHFCRLKVMIC